MRLAVYTLWRREIVRFMRQRSRLMGALLQPIVFWLLLGGGLSPSFRPPGATGGEGFMSYFYPGVLALVLLFTAIFATIAVVEDRKSGFLQGVLVAPISRTTIVLGQSCGATTLAVLQGVLCLALAPVAGISLTVGRVLAATGIMTLIGFALCNLGLAIAWRMESTQGFHAIMNLVLMPMWFLSGAFFPSAGLPGVLAWLMRLDPLTYGLAALRASLLAQPPVGLPSMAVSLGVTAVFAGVMLAVAVAAARRSATL